MGQQALLNTALDQFAIPGDASFPLNQAFEAPSDRQDAETMRQWDLTTFSSQNASSPSYRYLSQVRQELAMRLLARVYADGSTPSKASNNGPLPWIVGANRPAVVVEFYEA